MTQVMRINGAVSLLDKRSKRYFLLAPYAALLESLLSLLGLT
jgi:hypothetical protein